MLNLEDLNLFIEFYRQGTLTKVAETHHMSQPSLTRVMKRVEESFGVKLFSRSANRLEFNEIGKKAVELSEELLKASHRCTASIQELDSRLHSIRILSCAPAPLSVYIADLANLHPDMMISSKLMEDVKEIEACFQEQEYDAMILPYPLHIDDTSCEPLLEEHLSICVTKKHPLAKYKQVTMQMLNGHNCLLYSNIGFWTKLCKQYMPDSQFLVQTNTFAINELIRESNLPCFITNTTTRYQDAIKGRIIIPITDKAVNVTYYLIKRIK